ncbi:MAG: hypothetical protein JNJ71_07280 [Rubrivivax sp.]|nr:hypothetical protein [Rubrivivax sp.]
MKPLRWLLALLAPAVGLFVAFAGVVLLTDLLVRACPPDLLVSGMCTASWYPAAERAAFAVAAFVGALVFVWLPVKVAPAYKNEVRWVCLSAGSVFAAIFVWQAGPELLPSLFAALAGGALAARFSIQPLDHSV